MGSTLAVAPPSGVVLTGLRVTGLRCYRALAVEFPAGPILVTGSNGAGKSSLVEAIVVAARGRSPRTANDTELIRFDAELTRIEADLSQPAAATATAIELVIARPGAVVPGGGGRKRLRINGVARRIGSLADALRIVLFTPEDMQLVSGPPSLRRAAADELAGALSPAYLADLSTYGRALAQRNSLLRAIREGEADRTGLRLWDEPFLDAGSRLVERRLSLLDELRAPLVAAHREIAPGEAEAASIGLRYETNAPSRPGEPVRAALARRLHETAEKEVWNGATLVGPHRDDVVFTLGDRDLAAIGSRGQQRTAILALKLAEIDVLTERDGRPPLLLLDDVFSELDPDRRAHLVRRLTALPQAFVTATTLADLDHRLVELATTYTVHPGPDDTGSWIRADR
jgi:DNA replication and repair protein RecF